MKMKINHIAYTQLLAKLNWFKYYNKNILKIQLVFNALLNAIQCQVIEKNLNNVSEY